VQTIVHNGRSRTAEIRRNIIERRRSELEKAGFWRRLVILTRIEFEVMGTLRTAS
jgi:hypothetical protein